jgi:beta-galactosidase
VTIQQFDEPHYQELTSWTITGYAFENLDNLYRLIGTLNIKDNTKNIQILSGPIIFHSEVELKEEDLGDTYWDASRWGKGFLVINGFNMGRYWPLAGPQISTFIPKDLLKVGKNKFTIIEQQMAPQDITMNFVDKPIFLN